MYLGNSTTVIPSTPVDPWFALTCFQAACRFSRSRQPFAGLVELRVFDITGREAVALVNEFKDGGMHQIDFEADHLPSGLYIYMLRFGRSVVHKKMLVLH
jgi:hypothetical protein